MSKDESNSIRGLSRDKRVLMPRVRFPDFLAQADWIRTQIGQVSTLHKGKGISKADVVASGVLPCIRYGELYTVYEENIHTVYSRTNVNPDGLFLSQKNDVIIPASGETAIDIAKASCVLQDGVALGGDLNVIRSSLHGTFLSYYLNGPLKSSIAEVAQGDAIVHLYPSQIAAINISLPHLEEQRKIAECLTSLDERITAETQKLDTLKIHRMGLMQQLFPREGETVPRLRFAEFGKIGAWEKVAAGQCFLNRTERGSSNLPIYSVTMTEGMVPRASLDRRIDDLAETSANKTVRKGDIAYNMMRMWQGALGVAFEDCMVSPAYVVLQPKGVNPYFFYFLLKLPQTLQVLTAHSRGLTEDRLRLYYDDFAKVPLLCPSLSEQERIADCLSYLDSLLATQSQKIVALKHHKMGLLQQMFPVLDVVSA